MSLTVADGEFVVLLGPTGAGKTTTLRLVARLGPARKGSRLDRRTRCNRRASGCAQRHFRIPAILALSASLGVTTIWRFRCAHLHAVYPKPEIATTVRDVARMLRIEENSVTRRRNFRWRRCSASPSVVHWCAACDLSDGRATLLARREAARRVSVELKRIQEDLGATILYVTHDQTEAMTLASRIGVIDHGRLVQIGTPREIYENPANSYVATRLGSPGINLLPVSSIPGLSAPKAARTIGARTEHVRIGKAQSGDEERDGQRILGRTAR